MDRRGSDGQAGLPNFLIHIRKFKVQKYNAHTINVCAYKLKCQCVFLNQRYIDSESIIVSPELLMSGNSSSQPELQGKGSL